MRTYPSLFTLAISLTVGVFSARPVYVFTDLVAENVEFRKLPTGETMLPTHAAVHVMGDETQGALRLQIAASTQYDIDYFVDILDYGVGEGRNKAPSGYVDGLKMRKIIHVGDTDMTNDQLRGVASEIAADAKGLNGGYIPYTRGCFFFAKEFAPRICPNAGMDEFEVMRNLFLKYYEKAIQLNTKPVPLGVQYREAGALDDPTQNKATQFKIEGGKVVEFTPSELASKPPNPSMDLFNDEVRSSMRIDRTPLSFFGEVFQDRSVNVASPFSQGLFGGPQDDGSKSGPDDEVCRRSSGLDLEMEKRGSCRVSIDPAKVFGPKYVALVRVASVINTVTMVVADILNGVGAALAVVGGFFVILDYTRKDWVGAGFATAGLILGVVAAAEVGGPLGIVVGIAIAALFAVLPRVFKNLANKPSANDPQEIIQAQMFGDAHHTGNEECQKQNPNCQAVYGVGVIALTFGWDIFKAGVFLLIFNDGFPMSIPDMKEVFKFNGTPGALAVIDCHNTGQTHIPGNAFGLGVDLGEDPKYCWHPQFNISEEAIEMPHIPSNITGNEHNNATAAEVRSRIFNDGNGDCAMYNNPSVNVTFSLYDLTISGMPVTFACNITDGINDNGHFRDVGNPDPPDGYNDPGTASAEDVNTKICISPANASTDGNAGHYVCPPPPFAFWFPFNTSNSPCFVGTTGTGCYPSGTWDVPTGAGGFRFDGVTDVTFPPAQQDGSSGASIQVFKNGGYSGKAKNAGVPITAPYQTKEVVEWVTQNKADIQSSFQVTNPFTEQEEGGAFGVCLLTGTAGRGDVWCVGEGGGDIPEELKRAGVRGVKVFGKAIVRIYAFAYGDGGAQTVTADTLDLSVVPYKTDDDFSGKVVAVWVTCCS